MPKSRRSITFRLDAWGLFLLAVFVIVLVIGVWPVPENPVQSVREMTFFREKYGPATSASGKKNG